MPAIAVATAKIPTEDKSSNEESNNLSADANKAIPRPCKEVRTEGKQDLILPISNEIFGLSLLTKILMKVLQIINLL